LNEWINEWMNEWQKLYGALKSLQMYAWSTALHGELKTRTKPMSERKTVRPRVREISPGYLWWSLRWKRLEEEMCFKSRVKKGRSDWWWQRWRWQCGSDLWCSFQLLSSQELRPDKILYKWIFKTGFREGSTCITNYATWIHTGSKTR